MPAAIIVTAITFALIAMFLALKGKDASSGIRRCTFAFLHIISLIACLKGFMLLFQ